MSSLPRPAYSMIKTWAGRLDIALFENADQLRWNGPTPAFAEIGARLDAALTMGGGRKTRDAP